MIAKLHHQLQAQKLHPFSCPIGIDLRNDGLCIRCNTCDGYPCQVLAKRDTDVCAVRPALESQNVTLWTNAKAVRLLTNTSGRDITAIEVERNGQHLTVSADRYVVACGAVNSAALLLRSANSSHPNGVANKSGLVGRNFMMHNNSGLTAINPNLLNSTKFQKTMAVNDFYFGTDEFPYPMGNLQLVGKVLTETIEADYPWLPRLFAAWIASHSVDWQIMSEDLPDPNNRVFVNASGQIQLYWQPNNLAAHKALVQAAKRMMRQANYRILHVQREGIGSNAHQCGTLRFGIDPSTSVLDPHCKAHDINNLYVMDSSFFPSSAAVNPSLTIAAQALRMADHFKTELHLFS